jgi:hypothetical protein
LIPSGPALLYVTEGEEPTVTVLDRADFSFMSARDRVLCRALLGYALRRLDEADRAQRLVEG